MHTEDSEREKYEATWSNPDYRVKCHGLDLWQSRRDLFPVRPQSAIDFGCGTGRLVRQWLREGIGALGIDMASNAPDPDMLGFVDIACLWDPLLPKMYDGRRKVDMGCCADVMEHIPPEHVEAVIRNIHEIALTCVYKIANYPSVFGASDLHLTQRPSDWWREMFHTAGARPGEPILGRPGIQEYIFVVNS